MDKNEAIIDKYINQLAAANHQILVAGVEAEILQKENDFLKNELKAATSKE